MLRDAIMTVLKTQELAGLDLITDGELVRFDPSHPETNGMVDYFVSQMEGIRSHFATSDFDRYRADRSSIQGLLTAGMVLFDNLSTLLFGNARISRLDESGVELLVNRGMNLGGERRRAPHLL